MAGVKNFGIIPDLNFKSLCCKGRMVIDDKCNMTIQSATIGSATVCGNLLVDGNIIPEEGKIKLGGNTIVKGTIFSSQDEFTQITSFSGIEVFDIEPITRSQIDFNPMTVQIVKPPCSGSIQNVNMMTGVISYLPKSEFARLDIFQYTIDDICGIKHLITQLIFQKYTCPQVWTPQLDTAYNTNAQVLNDQFLACTIDQNGKVLTSYGWNVYRFNTDGTLDNTFGTGGIADLSIAGFLAPSTNQSDEQDGWNQIVVDQNENIFVVGTISEISLGRNRASVHKLLPNGTLDVTFGTNGRWIDNQTNYSGAYAMTINNIGDIFLAGFDGFYSSVSTHLIIKLTSNGNLDTFFGNSGYSRIPVINDEPEGELRGIHTLDDGRIVAGGYFSVLTGGFRAGFGVMRIFPNGIIDSSYGDNNGWSIYIHNDFDAYAYSAHLIDEEMYVLGYIEDESNLFKSAVVKFDINGIVDETFADDGALVLHINPPATSSSNYDVAETIIKTCDGDLIVGGRSEVSAGNYFESFIYKVSNDGVTFDENWGANGIYHVGSPAPFYELAMRETDDNIEIYGVGYGPPGDGSYGTVTKINVPV